MATEQTVKNFVSGTHNVLPNEEIPKDAASDSLNWITKDGRIELAYGRQLVGVAGGAGKNYGEHTAYRADGTAVRFRKINTKVQTLVSGTWTDVITGLSETDYVFSNYQSLAGAFVYIFGVDGLFKIATANPTSYASLYDSTKNFKGFGFIDKGRTILWGRAQDPTGLYGSYIDAQNSTVYTTVTAEATTSLTGTLAFKAGGSKRTCFGIALTITASGEVYTDNYNGVLTGSLGGTGTINYMTGDYTVTNPGVGTVNYQWEDSNVKGVTDFTKSATRLAGEGFILRQDSGGDAILNVLILNGNYFSIKKQSCYRLALDSADTSPTNEVFRTDIGVPSMRAAVATGQGIFFMNTANPSRPRLSVIQQNPLGDNFDMVEMFSHYDFSVFTYDDCMLDTWDRFIIVGCAYDSANNNRLLICDFSQKSVDATYYGIRTSTKSGGFLYGGDTVSESTYELFTGFDDLGISLENNWDSKGETFGSDILKKIRYERFMGRITPDQSIGVYLELDDSTFSLIGTILGTGDYVDYNTSFALGTSFVGQDTIGGGDSVNTYNFLIQLKVKTGKFRKRIIRFKALGIGYASIWRVTDHDIWTYENKLPRSYRLKQNVSLDGTVTDRDNPQY